MNSDEIRIGLSSFYRDMDGEWFRVEYEKEHLTEGLDDLVLSYA